MSAMFRILATSGELRRSCNGKRETRVKRSINRRKIFIGIESNRHLVEINLYAPCVSCYSAPTPGAAFRRLGLTRDTLPHPDIGSLQEAPQDFSKFIKAWL